jgi:hypothetical protein
MSATIIKFKPRPVDDEEPITENGGSAKSYGMSCSG